jgi:hypothetical protein
MNPVRKLVDDLINKKLWPVALALVLAAVAIPVLISGSGSDAGSDVPDPSFALAAPGAASASPAVELVGPPAVRSRDGAVRDPFRRKKVAPPATTATSPPASSAGASSGATTSTGAATTGGAKVSSEKPATSAPTSTPSVSTATTAAARSAYQTVVRFTRPGGTRERPLARLAVLGNSDSPALQYLGVSGDGQHAIFVLGAKATADDSDAACIGHPCRAVGLGRGDKLGVDVLGKDLVVRHYVVEVIGLRRLVMATAADARVWRARVDPAGGAVRRVLREDPALDSVFTQLRYAASTGTVGLVSAP